MDSRPRLTIRLATRHDAPALYWLAVLCGMPRLTGRTLLAERDGVPSAALSLETGAETADPHQPTAHARRALRARRATLLASVRRRRGERAADPSARA